MNASELAAVYRAGGPLTDEERSKARRYIRRTPQRNTYYAAQQQAAANAARIAAVASCMAV